VLIGKANIVTCRRGLLLVRCSRSRDVATSPAQQNCPSKSRDPHGLGHILLAELFIDGEGFGPLARRVQLLGTFQTAIRDNRPGGSVEL